MFNNWYDAEYAHKENERRLQAHLVARALLKTIEDRNKTMANRTGRRFRLPMSLVTTTWHWGKNMAQRTGHTLHMFGKRPLQHNR